ncbi:Phosphopantetheine attachment site [Legionella busanensis]|uniref:Phosphopantetheine attachment site n=1 Tax=Legionella busanensis TaxID=190655 RepID=A0A378JRL2_9GAMM|nr:phosphopantetheine-binding protein [Legionella busanensis]STX50772.1 Phosphopantetheine attachment site [Legionella busanensis]
MNHNIDKVEASIISVLNKIPEVSNIEIKGDTSLLDLNLDSLNAMLFISDLEKELHIPLSINLEPNTILMYPTVKELATYIHHAWSNVQ